MPSLRSDFLRCKYISTFEQVCMRLKIAIAPSNHCAIVERVLSRYIPVICCPQFSIEFSDKFFGLLYVSKYYVAIFFHESAAAKWVWPSPSNT